MARRAYRDKYDARGTYARENEAMLDAERSRTLDWQNESTHYKLSLAPLLSVAAVFLLTVVVLAAIYFLPWADLE